MEQMERMEQLEQLEQLALQAHKACKASKVLKVLQVQQDQRVQWVQQDLKVLQEYVIVSLPGIIRLRHSRVKDLSIQRLSYMQERPTIQLSGPLMATGMKLILQMWILL